MIKFDKNFTPKVAESIARKKPDKPAIGSADTVPKAATEQF